MYILMQSLEFHIFCVPFHLTFNFRFAYLKVFCAFFIFIYPINANHFKDTGH